MSTLLISKVLINYSLILHHFGTVFGKIWVRRFENMYTRERERGAVREMLVGSPYLCYSFLFFKSPVSFKKRGLFILRTKRLKEK